MNWRSRLLIKELGNNDTDGHFFLGFADGPEISPMEILHLILDTLCNSTMAVTSFLLSFQLNSPTTFLKLVANQQASHYFHRYNILKIMMIVFVSVRKNIGHSILK
jgi:hypothetical protein